MFNYKPKDIFGCLADIGWITGHSYVVYGPLSNGGTTVLFESTPTYPNPGRYWDTVDRLKINQLYIAPTSIRGSVLGLDLYVDKNFTATTFDDDSAIILAPEAFTVYRSPQAYMSVNVVSNLQVQVAIYGFMATIAKMPNGIIKYQKV